jgi:hypothetical protein
MKKNYLLSLLLILVVFFVIYSCRKENTQSESNSLTDPNAAMDKKQAQNYYYNILMKQPGTSTATTNGIQTTDVNTTAKRNWKYLMFDLSYTSQTPNVTFIEIPLRYNQRPSTLITKDAVTAASPAQLNILNAGYDRLLIYKNKSTGQIDQTIVTFIPDSAYLQKHHNDISSNHIDKLDADFNGFLLYKKWDGTPTYLLTVHNGVYTNNYNFSTTPISVNNTGKLMTDALPKNSTFAVICVGYWVQPMIEHCWATDPEFSDEVCGAWMPDGPPYWVNLYCYDDGSAPPPPQPPSILPAPPTPAPPVVSASQLNAAATLVTISPKVPILDIKTELKCFNNLAPATLTIYVAQPSPGTRSPYNGFDVGHSFISISQQNANGQTIIRTLGFYPNGSGNPITPIKPSILGNDGGHTYNVSYTLNLTPGQFNGIYGFIMDYQSLNGGKYDLNNFNCTNFANDIAGLAGLTLPYTTNSWPLGGGMNPGDFGQDLLQSYGNNSSGNSAQLNINGANAPSDSGNCN